MGAGSFHGPIGQAGICHKASFLKEPPSQVEVDAVVLRVTGAALDLAQAVAPLEGGIHALGRAGEEADAGAHDAGGRGGGAAEIPAGADIEERCNHQPFAAAGIAKQRRADFHGGGDAGVAHESVLAVAAHGVRAAHGELLAGEQSVGGVLARDARDEGAAGVAQAAHVLGLREEGDELGIVALGMHRGVPGIEAEGGGEAGGEDRLFIALGEQDGRAKGSDDGLAIDRSNGEAEGLAEEEGAADLMLRREAENQLAVDGVDDRLVEGHAVGFHVAGDAEDVEGFFLYRGGGAAVEAADLGIINGEGDFVRAGVVIAGEKLALALPEAVQAVIEVRLVEVAEEVGGGEHQIELIRAGAGGEVVAEAGAGVEAVVFLDLDFEGGVAGFVTGFEAGIDLADGVDDAEGFEVFLEFVDVQRVARAAQNAPGDHVAFGPVVARHADIGERALDDLDLHHPSANILRGDDGTGIDVAGLDILAGEGDADLFQRLKIDQAIGEQRQGNLVQRGIAEDGVARVGELGNGR